MCKLGFGCFALYMRRLLHVCLSWEIDPSSVALPWGFFHLFSVWQVFPHLRVKGQSTLLTSPSRHSEIWIRELPHSVDVYRSGNNVLTDWIQLCFTSDIPYIMWGESWRSFIGRFSTHDAATNQFACLTFSCQMWKRMCLRWLSFIFLLKICSNHWFSVLQQTTMTCTSGRQTATQSSGARCGASVE